MTGNRDKDMAHDLSSPSGVKFGHTELPPKQVDVLRKAIRLEWITIGFLAITVTLVALVLGNSQAMKAAWIEDLLSFIPPVAFLIAVRVNRRAPTLKHPYGYHRSVGVGHLVSAVALTTMGTYLIIDSATGLIKAEHPTIGTVVLFGQTVWLGWLMIGVMAAIALPPVLIGRAKMDLAKQLHNKLLYADADMNKADWMTAVGSIVGVAGIGLGVWWLDSAAALFIAGSILYDGVRNLKAAILDLMDERATTFDDKKPHPVSGEVEKYLRSLSWVADAGCRVRDEGHVFHIEAFLVPIDDKMPSLDTLERTREACIDIDWKVQDIVLVLVPELPDVVGSKSGGTHG
ncbi:cation diffusion facilitator family transporter [Cryobacterium sp.]|jgi:cation diffusion facilitator family transporter|uniref:cation diffusion facilitator family transporter n=1 Tax=Cryobacterium sp. TaxID=1926290 RepID=UPI002603CDA5|nr:cation diffusion facilitator family transporter [Cryobacterium sp.]MCU1445591.1 cation transporter [Cryobacterium sp.]